MKQGRWLGLDGAGRMWRTVRPDRNPLRRKADRVEAFIFGALLVAAAVTAPVAAIQGGHWAYASAREAARVQQETTYRVRAVLLSVPGTSPGGYSIASVVPARAQWTAPGGAARTGEIPVAADSAKGEAVMIWTDPAGDVTTPPMTPAEVSSQGMFGTIIGIVLTLLTVLLAAGTTRFLVNRRRMAAWEADWAVTAPMWTRQSW